MTLMIFWHNFLKIFMCRPKNTIPSSERGIMFHFCYKLIAYESVLGEESLSCFLVCSKICPLANRNHCDYKYFSLNGIDQAVTGIFRFYLEAVLEITTEPRAFYDRVFESFQQNRLELLLHRAVQLFPFF